jgi:glycosyltransferase involved in cell wall biosynthesis
MRTWQTKIAVYIALSKFGREKFIEGGLPAERIVVKPNFVHPEPVRKTRIGEYALYVGRLSAEKGLRTLLEAWSKLRMRIPLQIAGDGPLRGELEEKIHTMKLEDASVLGRVLPRDVIQLMLGAKFLVFPSVWFETFGLTIAEAFACELPVIASRLGTMAEIVTDNKTGLHFKPGDSQDLAAKIEWAWSHQEAMSEMGRAARREFEEKYTSAANYRRLMEIYETAMAKPVFETAELMTAR